MKIGTINVSEFYLFVVVLQQWYLRYKGEDKL